MDHSPKTRSGIGLVWRVLDDKSPIYSRKLLLAEVERRISHCHAPYWAAVTRAIEAAHGASGRVVHLNCHSMPAEAGPVSWVKQGHPLCRHCARRPRWQHLLPGVDNADRRGVSQRRAERGDQRPLLAWNWSSVSDARRTTGTTSRSKSTASFT